MPSSPFSWNWPGGQTYRTYISPPINLPPSNPLSPFYPYKDPACLHSSLRRSFLFLPVPPIPKGSRVRYILDDGTWHVGSNPAYFEGSVRIVAVQDLSLPPPFGPGPIRLDSPVSVTDSTCTVFWNWILNTPPWTPIVYWDVERRG